VEKIELSDLRWAIAVSQHRSLRQAAQTVNIRQSTLSRRLRDIEYRLGACLFERTNGGTRPTAIGLEFLQIARRDGDFRIYEREGPHQREGKDLPA
jgi:DNA-binding transcriptional LysR family regulator